MSDTVNVMLWGTKIGVLGYENEEENITTFEYSDTFIKMGISPSPLKLKISILNHKFEDISSRTFKGLAGFIADSLPDKFGNQLIDQYFASKGKGSDDISALDRLLYVGDRAMGALEYEPSREFSKASQGIELDVVMLSELAEMVLNKKESFAKELLQKHKNKDAQGALNLLRIGSSAGGARAKALVAMDETGKLYDGTIKQDIPCKYYLMKFDSASNSDRDNQDPKGMTRIEYIYFLIAKECEINVPMTTFIKSGTDFHFLIERFDRILNKDKSKLDKLHYVSWCGMAHADRDTTGSYGYEQLVSTARELGLGQDSITEIFKRAIFNIVGKNQDDHTKNFGFLMDRSGKWSLSPAFDLTYSYDPTGKWTKVHQITFNMKQDNFLLEDILRFAKLCNIQDSKAKKILSDTVKHFRQFETLALKYEVDTDLKNTVFENMRLNIS